MITALSPPGCGRNEISVRFIRHMNIIGMDSFDDETLRRIFTTEVDWHFKVGSFNKLMTVVTNKIVFYMILRN